MTVVEHAVVAVMCSCLPSQPSKPYYLPSHPTFETQGAHRLEVEIKAVKTYQPQTVVLPQPTTDAVEEAIKASNPLLLHLSAHNQYVNGAMRVVSLTRKP